MKQKVVIRVSNGDNKKRTKALKTAVGAPGVESVVLEGTGMNQIALTGHNLDAVNLTVRLRKKLGFAELMSVIPITGEGRNTEEAVTSNPIVQPTVWQTYHSGVPHFHVFENMHSQDNCSIL